MKYLQCLVLVSVIWNINSVSYGKEGSEQAIQPVVTTIENCTAPAPKQTSKKPAAINKQSATKIQTIVYCPQTKQTTKSQTNDVLAEEKEPVDQKLIVGEVEKISLSPPNITYNARIDTGANTSSLNAFDITPFERDGKKWVKFKLKDSTTDKITEISRQIVRKIKVKQHSANGQKRYIVKMNIRLGNIEQRIEFSLTNRSDYEFPVLIGRNFLKDMAVVDVSKKFTQKVLPPEPEPEPEEPEQTPSLAADEQQ